MCSGCSSIRTIRQNTIGRTDSFWSVLSIETASYPHLREQLGHRVGVDGPSQPLGAASVQPGVSLSFSPAH
jgi:hypothetical protein